MIQESVRQRYAGVKLAFVGGFPQPHVFVNYCSELVGRGGRLPVPVPELHLVGMSSPGGFAPTMCPARSFVGSLPGPSFPRLRTLFGVGSQGPSKQSFSLLAVFRGGLDGTSPHLIPVGCLSGLRKCCARAVHG